MNIHVLDAKKQLVGFISDDNTGVVITSKNLTSGRTEVLLELEVNDEVVSTFDKGVYFVVSSKPNVPVFIHNRYYLKDGTVLVIVGLVGSEQLAFTF